MGKTRFFSVYKLPLVLQPNAFYYVYSNKVWESYLTDNSRKLFPIGNTEMIKAIVKAIVEEGGVGNNTVTDYRADYDKLSLFVYSGYLLNGNPIIKRVKDNIEEVVQNVTNLETDWINRLTLIYI